jgi:chemotaxis protein MotB
MSTSLRAQGWDEPGLHGTAVLQRVEAGLPWELDAERGRADQDGWLLSFIDVLTLLLTLFVLLLAYQHGAAERAEAVAAQATARTAAAPAMETPAETPPETAFVPQQEPAPDVAAASMDERAPVADYVAWAQLLETDWLTPMLVQVARAGMPAERAAESASSELPQSPGQTALETAAAEADAPGDPLDRLLAELNEPALQGRVEVTRQPGGLDLQISDSILFTPASAALTESGRALLDELAGLLVDLPYELSVEGHTDDRPIATQRFPSNWELASSRASGVTRYLIGRGIAPGRVRAIGYADTRPLADNASAEGRSRNRRVSFILRLPAA